MLSGYYLKLVNIRIQGIKFDNDMKLGHIAHQSYDNNKVSSLVSKTSYT